MLVGSFVPLPSATEWPLSSAVDSAASARVFACDVVAAEASKLAATVLRQLECRQRSCTDLRQLCLYPCVCGSG